LNSRARLRSIVNLLLRSELVLIMTLFTLMDLRGQAGTPILTSTVLKPHERTASRMWDRSDLSSS
jgi:hypothetical protein